MEWICGVCGYVYDGEDFTAEGNNYRCPLCDHGKEEFTFRNITAELEFATNEVTKDMK